MTREEWLIELTRKLRSYFENAGYPLPEKIRASCGFPSKGALATKARRIGECWSCESSDDKHFETFVSPLLSDALEVAATQVHELCHAAVGPECGHKKPFRGAMKAVGLEGKPTATNAGPELTAHLQKLIAEIGPYPHAKLTKAGGLKKQGTRMLKLECPSCGYLVRTAAKWLEVGVPTCPCGEKMRADEPDDEECREVNAE